jgi:predicted CXXCH cytochrome family protein
MTRSFVKISCYILSIMIIIAGVCISLSEAAGIQGSAHDFSVNSTGSAFSQQFQVGPAGNWGDPISEICVFCHTPHGASQDAETSTLLWNRVTPVGLTYTPYTASTSTTIAPDTAGRTPTGISMMCMSCHDGVTSIAVGTLKNAPGAGNPEVSLDPSSSIVFPGAISNAGGFSGGANIGNTQPGDTVIDLSNDHPISFEWNTSVPGYIYPPARTELRLFGASGMRIECATCHSVHNPTNYPFLSMPNTNSDMCRACHDK